MPPEERQPPFTSGPPGLSFLSTPSCAPEGQSTSNGSQPRGRLESRLDHKRAIVIETPERRIVQLRLELCAAQKPHPLLPRIRLKVRSGTVVN